MSDYEIDQEAMMYSKAMERHRERADKAEAERDALKLELAARPDKERIDKALDYILRYGGIDGGHHKQWVLDQVVKALTGGRVTTVTHVAHNGTEYKYDEQGPSEEYDAWIKKYEDGEDGPKTYEWDTGTPP